MADDNLTQALDNAFTAPAEPAKEEPAAEPEKKEEPAAEPETADEPAPDKDETKTEPAPADAPEPEPEVEDAAEAALSLTPEELAEIKSNPATAKLYKSLMRASTSKFQEISANKRVLQAMRDNPRAVIEAAAKNMGLVVSEAKDPATETRQAEVVDDVMADMINLFGPELAPTVRPVMEKLVKALVDKEVAPLREQQASDKKTAQENQAKAHAQTFRAKHADLSPEVEAKMMEIGKSVFPADGTDPGAYLDMLYTLATAGNTARETAKVAVDRIKAAKVASEPRRGGSPAPAKAPIVTADMSLDEAFDAAWAAAKAERT
jgi:hypothetical protein